MKNTQLLILFQWLLWAASSHSVMGTTNRHISLLCRLARPWTMLPDEQQCRKFYVCTGSWEEDNYQEFSCPPDYHFSSIQQLCVHGACYDLPSAKCNSSLASVERVQEDCTSYRRCTPDGAYALVNCPRHNYFDTRHKACLPVAVTADHQCSCLLPENSTVPNPSDCETYYRCEKGEAVMVQCPPNEYYDINVSSCVLDLTGICLEKPTMPPTEELDETFALKECASTGNLVVPHASDCSRYFLCQTGQVLEMSCPRGRYFNTLERYCSVDVGMECQANRRAKSQEATEVEASILNQLSEIETQDVITSYDKLSSKFVAF